MQAYKYFAKRQINGKPIEAVVYANTAQEALEKINDLGYIPKGLEKLNMLDLRIYARFDMQLPLWFNRFKLGHESEFDIQGKTINISAGGILFKTDRSLQLGITIDLMLELSETDEDIQCLSRVIRCDLNEQEKNCTIAVCFLDLTHSEQNRLNEFLNKTSQ
ncbi:MAG: PilZ domain-containing protein [Candidatus Omnitrophica bacterium]|nr:PilZ domain-containing protein [Candidatus Omnitrophota bacterium]